MSVHLYVDLYLSLEVEAQGFIDRCRMCTSLCCIMVIVWSSCRYGPSGLKAHTSCLTCRKTMCCPCCHLISRQNWCCWDLLEVLWKNMRETKFCEVTCRKTMCCPCYHFYQASNDAAQISWKSFWRTGKKELFLCKVNTSSYHGKVNWFISMVIAQIRFLMISMIKILGTHTQLGWSVAINWSVSYFLTHSLCILA